MRLPLTVTVVAAILVANTVSADPPQTHKLWPGKVPGEKGDVGPEKTLEAKPTEKNPVLRITDISEPTITIYHPAKDKDTGTAVIVAPGGGYYILAYEHEGTTVAEWLAREGVTAVLLKYRVPRRADQPKDQPPISALQDAQRAISVVRSKSKELGLKSDKIGMLGFSAGAHLTAWASTNDEKRSYEPVDAADKESCRPDFNILIYPGGIVGKESPDVIKPEIRVTKQTPPAFLVHAADDSAENSLAYVAALRKNGVPAELHLYASGGHGFGMRPIPHPAATWTGRCADWMRKQGYIP
jgi:acetyl esterase/lipase